MYILICIYIYVCICMYINTYVYIYVYIIYIYIGGKQSNSQTAGVLFSVSIRLAMIPKVFDSHVGKLQIELSTGRKLHCLTFATAISVIIYDTRG